ncbi:trypsin-like peptidase domain-containing protein [Chloroflexota bacterium]
MGCGGGTTPTQSPTPEPQLLTIQGVASKNITDTTVDISWETNEPASSQVEYGNTAAYEFTTPIDQTLNSSHVMTLTGLEPNTAYNYKVSSIDRAGNEAESNNFVFTTKALPTLSPTPSSMSVIEDVLPAVVRIEVGGGNGTGMIIDESGYILTNNHVVDDTETALVILEDGREFTGTIIGRDEVRDLAIVKIYGANLPIVTLGNSSELALGDEVIALGFPIYSSGATIGGATISKGIVSAFRYDNKVQLTLIQTDTAINPGNSGGPLINLDGDVIGINSMKIEHVSVEGINFAIATDSASPLIPGLMAGNSILEPTPHPTSTPKPTLPPTPTPPQSPTSTPIPPTGVLFSDDFSDASSGWATYSDEEGSALYENGWLHLTHYAINPDPTLSLTDQVFTDFVLEVETKLVSGTDDNWHTIFLRAPDMYNFYAFLISADGYCRIAKAVNDEATFLTDTVFSSHISQGQGVTNVIRIECVGSNLRLSVNGHLLLEATDSSLTSGNVVLGASALSGTFTEIAFDNIVITEATATFAVTSTPYQLIPADALTGAFIDIDLITSDETLEGFAESIGLTELTDDEELADFGIESAQIGAILGTSRENENVGIALGQFDFDSVRTHLEEIDFTYGSYEDVEFWTGYYGSYGDTGVAVIPDALFLAWGDVELVESIVRTIKGIDDSFENVAEVQEVLNRLPEGTPLINIVALDMAAEFDLPGTKNGSLTVVIAGGDLKLVWVLNCIDASTAQEIGNQVGDSMGATSVRQDGTWIVIELVVSIEEFSAGL